MLIRTGLGGQLSGSVGGVVASHNKGGQYLRNRSIPVNPNSQRQQLVRGAIGSAATLWQSLTPAQRAGWEGYAAGTPVINRLGESITVSGWNMFVRTYVFYVGANAPAFVPSNAPIVPGLAEFDAGFNVTSVSESLGIAFTGLGTEAVGPVLISIGPALSPGVTYFRGPYTAYYANFTATTIDPGPVVGNQAVNRYGLPIENEIRGIRVRGAGTDGRLTSSREFVATVIA